MAIVQFAIQKSVIVGDNTVQAECLGSFFEKLEKNSDKAGKN